MTEKNGERLIFPHVSETAAAATSPVVLFLEKLLTDARTGAFTSMATVAVGPHGQLMTGWAGGQRGEMYVGAAMVQQHAAIGIDLKQRTGLVELRRREGNAELHRCQGDAAPDWSAPGIGRGLV